MRFHLVFTCPQNPLPHEDHHSVSSWVHNYNELPSFTRFISLILFMIFFGFIMIHSRNSKNDNLLFGWIAQLVQKQRGRQQLVLN